MTKKIVGSRKAVAPLLATMVLVVAGCGGGGGGDSPGAGAGTASALGAPAGANTQPIPPADGSAPPAGSGTGDPAPVAEARYSLGTALVANTTTEGFQTLQGIGSSAGGYRIVWVTASFDANGNVQRTTFERHFDAAGQPVGGEAQVESAGELSGNPRVQTPGGGYVQVYVGDQMRPSLFVQHFSASGEPLDPPIQLGGAAHSWSYTALRLPNGAIALTWQPVSSVGPGELQTALLVPGPR